MKNLPRARAALLALGAGALGSLAMASSAMASAPLAGTNCTAASKVDGAGGTLQTWVQNSPGAAWGGPYQGGQGFISSYQQGVCGTVAPDPFSFANVLSGTINTPTASTANDVTDAGAAVAFLQNGRSFKQDESLTYNYPSIADASLTGSGNGLIGLSCRWNAYTTSDIPYSTSQFTDLSGNPGKRAGSAAGACPAKDGFFTPFEPEPSGPFTTVSGHTQATYPNPGDINAKPMSFPVTVSAIGTPVNLPAACYTTPSAPTLALTTTDEQDIWGGTVATWGGLPAASSGTSGLAITPTTGPSGCNSTVNVASTSTFPATGNIAVTNDAGLLTTLTYTGTTATSFTGVSGNGASTVGAGAVSAADAVAQGNGTSSTGTQTLPVTTFTVSTTFGFAAPSGSINVTSSTGPQTLTYSGVTATSFTGVTGGTGVVSPGAAVTQSTGAGTTTTTGSQTIPVPGPNLNITRTVRQDNSGTTQGFVNYLGDALPAATTCVPGNPNNGTFALMKGNEASGIAGGGTNVNWPGGPANTAPPAGCSQVVANASSGGQNLLNTLEANVGGVGYADYSDVYHDNNNPDLLVTPSVLASDGMANPLPNSGGAANWKLGAIGSSACANGSGLPGPGAAAVGLSGQWGINFAGNTWSDIAWTHQGSGYPICTLTWDLTYQDNNGNTDPSATTPAAPVTQAVPTNTTSTGSQSLPVGTFTVASTATFAATGTIVVASSAGTQTLSYTGTTLTSFTGVSGGTGTVSAGTAVTQGGSTLLVSAPAAVAGPTSGGGFPNAGTITVTDATSGAQLEMTYSGITGTTWPAAGCPVAGCSLSNVALVSSTASTSGDSIAAGSVVTVQPASVSSAATVLPAGTLSVSSTGGAVSPDGQITGTGALVGYGGSTSYAKFPQGGLLNITTPNATTAAGTMNTLPITSPASPAAPFTVSVASTTGFPNQGTISVQAASGTDYTLAYTGLGAGNTLTGVTYTGATTVSAATSITAGQTVAWSTPTTTQTSPTGNAQTLPTATFSVTSTAGFPQTGTLLVGNGNAVLQLLTYTGITAGSFTGVTGGIGAVSGATWVSWVAGPTTATASSSPQSVTTAASTLTVGSTAGFPASGTIVTLSNTGVVTLTYTGTTATSFTGVTIASGSTAVPNGMVVLQQWPTVSYSGVGAGGTLTGVVGGTGTLASGATGSIVSVNTVSPAGLGGAQPNLTPDQRRNMYAYFTYILSPAGQSAAAGAGYNTLPEASNSYVDAIRKAFQQQF